MRATTSIDPPSQASPYDRIWGIGFSSSNAAANKVRWGQNLLGLALIRVRSRLRELGEAQQDA